MGPDFARILPIAIVLMFALSLCLWHGQKEFLPIERIFAYSDCPDVRVVSLPLAWTQTMCSLTIECVLLL